MNRISLTSFVAALIATSGGLAQNATAPTAASSTPPPGVSRASPQQTPATQAPKSTHSATTMRPDARYPHPSGQDSPAANSSGQTKVPAPGSKQDMAGHDRNPTASGRSKQTEPLAEQKTYTGNSGAKANLGTMCTTARPTADGGVDCGMSGNSATSGKTVTKSR
jgi:hypothetical protein